MSGATAAGVSGELFDSGGASLFAFVMQGVMV